MKFFFVISLLAFSFCLQAQTIYEDLLSETEGKFKTIKVKRSYGAVDRLMVKKGRWIYLDGNGGVLKEETYAMADEGSLKHGIWKYYNEEKQLIREVTYVYGKEARLRLYAADSIIDGDYTYAVNCDSLICKERVYHKDELKYTRTTAKGRWKDVLSTFDPNKYMNDLPEKEVVETQYIKQLKLHSDFRGPERSNLLQNGKFTEIDLQTTYIEGIAGHVHHWFPASGTPDYFAMAPDTNGALGIRVATVEGSYLEYIGQRLNQPLRRGYRYGFRMKVKLAKASAMAADAMGVWFGPRVFEFGYFSQGQMPVPQVRHPSGVVLINSDEWVWVEGEFMANGNEQFVVIGSFTEQRNMKLESFVGAAPEAYYLIDDAELFVLEAASSTPFDKLKKGDVLTLENVWFENDQDELLPQSIETLQELADYMMRYPERKLKINGHTSSLGDYDHNIDLSQRRSKQVKQFLVAAGISEERLQSEGYGPDRPVADNRTEEGQALNRRVEVEVLE